MAEVAAAVDLVSGVSDVADSSDSSPKNDLIQQLDELLERYLHTLDEYQKVRNEMSEKLASVCHYQHLNHVRAMLTRMAGLYVISSSQLPQLLFYYSVWKGLLRRSHAGYPKSVSSSS